MKTPVLVLWLLVGVVALSMPPAFADEQDVPVVEGEVGREAFDALRTWYGGGAKPDCRRALKALTSKDAALRRWGGQFLHAFFQQELADEKRGLTPPRDGYALGGGPQDLGAEQRWLAASDFRRTAIPATCVEALPAALWLFRKDPLVVNRISGLAVLCKVRAPASDAVVAEVLVERHPDFEVLELVLATAAARKLDGVAKAVQVLTQHHSPKVAAAAKKAAETLGIPLPEAAAPTLPKTVDASLRRLATLVPIEIPEDATWYRFRFKGSRWINFHDCRLDGGGGWLLSTEGDEYVVLDWFGQPRRYKVKRTVAEPESLAACAERLVAQRIRYDTTEEEEGGFARDSWHSRFRQNLGDMRFMRQGGAKWGGSLPEVLVAAWCLMRGDAASAAKIVLPLNRMHDDDASLVMGARESLATQLDQSMLEAFTVRRYDEALVLAQHLSQDAFKWWRHQDRALGLAEQLPRRTEDFKTLKLPPAAAWKTQRATMSRTQQIDFLGKRLRLIHAVQGGIPGGINWSDAQYEVPSDEEDNWQTRGRWEVINPYVELWRMNLHAYELKQLFPLLDSTDYILAYDVPRFMPHYPMNFFKVSWVTAGLVNEVAQKTLVSFPYLREKKKEIRIKELEALRTWILEDGGMGTLADRIAPILEKDEDWEKVKRAFWSLRALDEERTFRAVYQRSLQDDKHRAELVQVLAAFDRKEYVEQARRWASSNDPDLVLWGSLLLLRHGDRKRCEGLQQILARLGRKSSQEMRDALLDDLLALRSRRVNKLLCSYFDESPPAGVKPTPFFLQRMFLAGYQPALEHLIAALIEPPLLKKAETNESGGLVFSIEEDDHMLHTLWSWRYEKKPYPHDLDVTERLPLRKSMARWIREQFALVRAGKRHDVRKLDAPKPLGDWGWASSGWVRRL